MTEDICAASYLPLCKWFSSCMLASALPFGKLSDTIKTEGEGSRSLNYRLDLNSTSSRVVIPMGYGEAWKVLDNLIVEFRKRGEAVPSNVIEDLRAAKTMIQVLKADPNRAENIPSIEMYLSSVESYLIFVGQQKFGDEFYDKWMAKLREARVTVRAGGEEAAWESASKFVPGIPRGKKWVRVQVSSETPESEIEELAGECGLSTKKQVEGFVLVYGDEEKLKLFVHKTGEKLQRRRGL